METPHELMVADLAASQLQKLPSNYIRPLSERPDLSQVLHDYDTNSSHNNIPLIDLQNLCGPDRPNIVKQIGEACLNYGFFQVKNHGISDTVVNNMLRVGREFFELPQSERLKNYSEDPSKTTRLSTSFNIKTEKVANWRDFLRLHCYPLQDFIHEWPTNPPSFRSSIH